MSGESCSGIFSLILSDFKSKEANQLLLGHTVSDGKPCLVKQNKVSETENNKRTNNT